MGKKKPSASKKGLSAQHQLFADSYLANGFNGAAAALEAEYSPLRARITASELLDRSDIQAYIKERFKKVHMSADEAVYRLAEHARGNVAEFLGLTIDEFKSHPMSWLVKKIEIDVAFPLDYDPKKHKPVQYIKRIELHDPQAAIRDIIKQHQLDSGLPTDIVQVMPTVERLVEKLIEAGKNPAEVLERMAQRLATEPPSGH